MANLGPAEYFWGGLTFLVGLLMWATQVPPRQAVSNLSEWLRAIGYESQPPWLRSRDADRVVRHLGGVAFLFLILVGLYLFVGVVDLALWRQAALVAAFALVAFAILQNLSSLSERSQETAPVAPDGDLEITLEPTEQERTEWEFEPDSLGPEYRVIVRNNSTTNTVEGVKVTLLRLSSGWGEYLLEGVDRRPGGGRSTCGV